MTNQSLWLLSLAVMTVHICNRGRAASIILGFSSSHLSLLNCFDHVDWLTGVLLLEASAIYDCFLCWKSPVPALSLGAALCLHSSLCGALRVAGLFPCSVQWPEDCWGSERGRSRGWSRMAGRPTDWPTEMISTHPYCFSCVWLWLQLHLLSIHSYQCQMAANSVSLDVNWLIMPLCR